MLWYALAAKVQVRCVQTQELQSAQTAMVMDASQSAGILGIALGVMGRARFAPVVQKARDSAIALGIEMLQFSDTKKEKRG